VLWQSLEHATVVVLRLGAMLVASQAVLRSSDISDMELLAQNARLPYWIPLTARLVGVAAAQLAEDWSAISDALWLRGLSMRRNAITTRLRAASTAIQMLIPRMLIRIREIDLLLESRGFLMNSGYPPRDVAPAWSAADTAFSLSAIAAYGLLAWPI